MLECVTTCVGYADFLDATLPHNLPLVDRLVVMTAQEDNATRRLCRQRSIRCVVSDEHKRNGSAAHPDERVFNKARLIQRALDQINGRDWILHLDADVVLPRRFRDLIDWAHLDPSCLYGIDRCNLTGWDAWVKLLGKGGWDNHSYQNFLAFPPEYPVGARWVSSLHGYVPIGFFQLWHGSSSVDWGNHVKTYPYHHGDAARSDVQFALQWDRRDRLLLPEVIALHLESESAKNGANWAGRTTKPFGPKGAAILQPGPLS